MMPAWLKRLTDPALSSRWDFSLTLLMIGFWCWFAWRHGFSNSPDSWYRLILGKSLYEGHAFFINMKQGWLYDYDPLHPDAAHSPLLPAIYAIWFKLFGLSAAVANWVVALGAGVLLLPLLRLGRLLAGSAWIGGLLYLLLVFNHKADVLFEVFAGLSIPFAVALLALLLWGLLVVARGGGRSAVAATALAAAAFYLIRPGEQLLFFWLLFWSVTLGYFLLPRPIWQRLLALWGVALVLVSWWIWRNIALFGSPFFSHMTPLFWTDRGYDYWSYHESRPYPSAEVYWASHSLWDLLLKLQGGILNYLGVLNETLHGQLPWLAVGFCYALWLWWRNDNQPRERAYDFGLLMLVVVLVGYSGLYSLVPLLDKRYMILAFFPLLMFLLAVGFRSGNGFLLRAPLVLLLVALFIRVEGDFWLWGDRFMPQIAHQAPSSDRLLAQDPTLKALREQIEPGSVVMGPLAEVQRINFATGITTLEAPDNLFTLQDPRAFFRRYAIRYSLLDVTPILPDSMIKSVSVVGNRLLFQIDLADSSAKESETPRQPLALQRDIESVSEGISKRRVLLDLFHGSAPPRAEILQALSAEVVSINSRLGDDRARLFNSGMLMVRYAIGRHEFSEAELQLLEEYAAAGGRIVLLCPAWVAVAYGDSELGALGFNRIAAKFGMIIGPDYASMPLTTGRGARLAENGAAFSTLVTRRTATTWVSDSQGHAVGAGIEQGDARLFLWGHDNLLNPELWNDPVARELIEEVFDWLWRSGDEQPKG